MKVKELTVEQLKTLIQEAVEDKLEEMIGDPDSGLELTDEVKERLRASMAAMQRGEEGNTCRGGSQTGRTGLVTDYTLALCLRPSMTCAGLIRRLPSAFSTSSDGCHRTSMTLHPGHSQVSSRHSTS